jgi:LytS/YehU family sensor histidine kinase
MNARDDFRAGAQSLPARDHHEMRRTELRDILWGIRQVFGPAILGLVLGSIALAIQGTSAAERIGVPGARLAIAYAVGLTIAGVVLGLGRHRLVKRSAARLVGTLAVYSMLLSMLEIMVIDRPKNNHAFLIALCAVLAPILAIPVVDGAWRRHFEQRDNRG